MAIPSPKKKKRVALLPVPLTCHEPATFYEGVKTASEARLR
jgi:hypothetical protein